MREGMQMRKGVETKEGAVLTNESSEGSEGAKAQEANVFGTRRYVTACVGPDTGRHAGRMWDEACWGGNVRHVWK